MRHLLLTLLASKYSFVMTPQRLDPRFLYYEKASPVRWGSYTLLKKFIEKHSRSNQEKKRYMKELDDFNKEINLGTHSNVKIKDIGQFHYSISPYKNAFFQGDLMDVLGTNKNDKRVKKENEGFVWLLLVINNQTKMLYFRPQKTKTGNETSKSLASIFKNDVHLEKKTEHETSIQFDQGGEFINKHTLKVLNQNGYKKMNIYYSNSRHKASLVERVIGTIRPRLARAMESKGSIWRHQAKSIIDNYNNTFHSAILMTPKEAEKNFEKCLFNLKLVREKKIGKIHSPKFKKGDIVRVRVHFPRTQFKKGSHRKFSAEVFTISSVQERLNNTTYKLKDENGRVMDGTYNDNDVIPGKKQEEYNVIILEKRKRNGVDEVLIQYDGFPESPPQWITQDDLIDL